MANAFVRCKVDVVARIYETKLKLKNEGFVLCQRGGNESERPKEGVGLLMFNEW